MTALREIFASFGVSFDTTELDRGDAAVRSVTDDLKNLGQAASEQEESIEGVGTTAGKVVDTLKGLAATLAAAFTIGAIKQSLTELTHQADELEKSALALGTSVEQLQQYRHAAGLANISADQLRAGFAKLQRAAADAAEGQGGSAKRFKDLGIELKDAQGKLRPAADLFDDVASKLGGMENATERNAAAMDLFGKSGFLFLPLFSEGADGIKKLRQEVEAYGGGITTEFAAKAAVMTDELQRQDLALLSLRVTLGNEILPLWSSFVAWTAKSTAALVKWLKNTKVVTAALVAFGAKGLAMLIRALPVVIKHFGGLGSVLTKLRGISMRALLPFLAIEDFIVFLAGGDSLIGRGLEKAFGAEGAEKLRKTLLDLPKLLGELIVWLVKLAEENGQTTEGMADKFRTFAADAKYAVGEFWTWLASAADIGAAHVMDALGSAFDWVFGKLYSLMKSLGELAGMAPKWLFGSTGDDWAKSFGNVADRLEGFSPEAQARRALSGDSTAVEEAEARAAERERVREPARQEASQRMRDFIRREEQRQQRGAELRALRESLEGYEDDAGMQSIAPSIATEPLQSTTVNQEVNQTNRIENNISVAPGTTEDQARDIARGAGRGTRDGLSQGTAALQDQLIPTPGASRG